MVGSTTPQRLGPLAFGIRFHVSIHRLFYYFSMLMKGNKMQVAMVVETFIPIKCLCSLSSESSGYGVRRRKILER